MKHKSNKALTNPEEHLNVPLWCVYGSTGWIKFIGCRLNISPLDPTQAVNLWGMGTGRKYQTHGNTLESFLKHNPESIFFLNQDDALEYLKKITTPRTDR